MFDRKGVIYKGRDNVDQFKSEYATDTKLRTLKEAIKGADVFRIVGKKCFGQRYGKIYIKNPVIFACANPDPEINQNWLMRLDQMQ